MYIFICIILFLFVSGYNSIPPNENKTPLIGKRSKMTLSSATKEEIKENTSGIKEEKKGIIGKIKIPNTTIDEPVLQAQDNTYFLTHDKKGNVSVKGEIFLDFRINQSTEKKIIYGHNSTSLDVPFRDLERYEHKDFYSHHKTIELTLWNKKEIYEIFSIMIEYQDFDYLRLFFPNTIQWEQHLQKLKKKSIYETEVEVKNEEILILQTCSHNEDYKKYHDVYLLIIGKKIA